MQISYLLTFESTHQAIHYEKFFKDQFAVELIPTPREISASCGLALQFQKEDYGSMKACLSEEERSKLKLYEWLKEGKTRTAIEISWRV